MDALKRTIIVVIIAYAFYRLQMSEEIEHRMVTVNGIQMHIAEEGEGPVVLLIHGFPELWYTWRHQMASLAAHGYRAVAPDLRGYGDTDAPLSVSNYTSLEIVGDLIELVNLLGQDKVFVVGHDWGAIMAWYMSLYRPDKVKALVTLSVPFQPRNPLKKPIQSLRATYGDEFYVIRFQEPGEMEAEFNRVGTTTVLKTFLSYHNPDPIYISKEKGFPSTGSDTLPSWLSEADLNYYTAKYEQKGFTGGLNYYRALDLNWELTAPWSGAQVRVPVKFIVGDMDLTYNGPGVKEFIHGGGLKKYVPGLEEVAVLKGGGHFINEERAEEVNLQILNFIKGFSDVLPSFGQETT